MLELVVLTPAFGLRNPSPFCLKMEMLLVSLGLPFDLTAEADPRKAPKGKLPYLVADGERMGDSDIMTQYLNDITDGAVYAGLTPQQQAHGLALARLVEDHLYWLIITSRWADDARFPHVVEGFFSIAPKLVRGLIANAARKQTLKAAINQGLGKHTLSEQQDFARRDLAALEATVPAAGFLFADKPGIYDFTLASIMAGIYDNQPDTWLTDIARGYPNLQAYTERVQSDVGVFGRYTSG